MSLIGINKAGIDKSPMHTPKIVVLNLEFNDMVRGRDYKVLTSTIITDFGNEYSTMKEYNAKRENVETMVACEQHEVEHWNEAYEVEGHDINMDIASKVGFGVLKVTNGNNIGKLFIFPLQWVEFTENAMFELQVRLLTYIALAHGIIANEFKERMSKKRFRFYIENMLGESLYTELADKFGL